MSDPQNYFPFSFHIAVWGTQPHDFRCQSRIVLYEYLPAGHVKGVEEVGNPLDGAGDELNVLPVHPIRLERTRIPSS
jgi:hypothetical protein